MRAWWRDGRLRFGVRPEPQLTKVDEVRVGVRLVGICRTDIAAAQGRLVCREPCVLGHEVVGVVEAVGPAVRSVAVGDRVAVRPLVDGVRLGVDRDGGFADRLVVSEQAIALVPPSLDWRRAAFVEPVAACLAVRHANLQGRVRVIGKGRIAELTRRVLLALAADLCDADHGGAAQVDVAIETGATAASLAEAMACVRDGGLIVLKGRPAAPIGLDVALAVQRELRFHAVGWSSLEDAFDLLTRLDVDDLLGEVHPLPAFADLLSADESVKQFLAPHPELIACAD